MPMASPACCRSLASTRLRELDGVVAVTPFSWFGGKYRDEVMPFAQFAIDPDTVFKVLDELTIPADQLKKFQESKDGCVIGRKLAEDKKLTLGSKLPLKGDAYPVDLDLTVMGIYDGPSNRDLRMCLIRFEYFDELFKRAVANTKSARQRASARATRG